MDKTNSQKTSEYCTYKRDGVSCDRSSHGGARGLCNTHFSLCSYHIKNGKKTWEQYEKEGMCTRKMTQDEKNMNQRHSHRTYRRKKKEEGLTEPHPDF